MKPSTLLLCLAVWFASLLSAYYIGSRQQVTAGAALETARLDSTPPSIAVPAAAAEPDLGVSPEFADPTLQSLLVGESPALSGSVARQLLGEAFALPKSDPNRSRLIRDLLGQLAETEPASALEWASQIESYRDRERARIAVLQVWGKGDPAAALAWADKALANEPARARNAQLTAIYRGYAASNPEAAFQQALALQDDNRLRGRLLGEVIETQVESGGLMAAKLAVDLVSDPDLQASLRRELVDEWAAFDPEAAAQYVQSLGDAANEQLKSTLVSEWAESDPAAAAAWLSGLSEDDPAIARASAAIIQEWTRYDLAASAEWLNSLPPSPELDRAVISYTFRAAEEDPETAMTWAESIENDRRRTWMMERVAATWKEQDSESFKSYLNASELTSEQRSALENPQRSGGPGGGWGR